MGTGQFDWGKGMLSMTPRGTVLVAEAKNNRVQEVSIDDGSHLRFLGNGLVEQPEYVDCNEYFRCPEY